ncbi:aminopeptidase [Conexibacter sp. W3-3-2]|uniref:aminopeptidase n=1 Tax=Conexibacter sp. W3-3-2 TaxID=2675227 RepID=UPI002814E7A6|nr:aminopeptidase [Conexibacter sp. W3-3-2]
MSHEEDTATVAGIVDPAAFADLIAGYCLEVEPHQQVTVRSTTLAAPLLLELQRAILQREGWPLLRVELPGQTRGYYEHAADWQLDDFPQLTLTEAKKLDATVAIQAPDDVHALQGLDPQKLMRARRARGPVSEATMKKRWCTSLWPTASLAAGAGMSLTEFATFVRGALFLDRPAGPVAAWNELGHFQDQLIRRVAPASEIRIEAPGTDLRLKVKGRGWVNSDGKRNMPSGEVFTGPHERSATGHIRFDVPSSPAGVEVSGVELEFRDGEVVKARADVGDAYLQQALATDDGARRLGELGIGTNFGIDRPVGVILFDEKIGGTVHCALGRSYDETGGKNRSALHWDLICDLRGGGRLTADGEVFQENGKFVL